MVAIAATNSSTPSVQASLNQSRLEQARREADQAENTARNLRAQADSAELDAEGSRKTVRELSAQAQQTLQTYAPPGQGSKSEVPTKVQDFIAGLYAATSQKRTDSGNMLKSNASLGAIINSQGQAIGRIVNLSA